VKVHCIEAILTHYGIYDEAEKRKKAISSLENFSRTLTKKYRVQADEQEQLLYMALCEAAKTWEKERGPYEYWAYSAMRNKLFNMLGEKFVVDEGEVEIPEKHIPMAMSILGLSGLNLAKIGRVTVCFDKETIDNFNKYMLMHMYDARIYKTKNEEVFPAEIRIEHGTLYIKTIFRKFIGTVSLVDDILPDVESYLLSEHEVRDIEDRIIQGQKIDDGKKEELNHEAQNRENKQTKTRQIVARLVKSLGDEKHSKHRLAIQYIYGLFDGELMKPSDCAQHLEGLTQSRIHQLRDEALDQLRNLVMEAAHVECRTNI